MTLLQRCKDDGLLTEDSIRKFPLTYSNLQVVLKIYAVKQHEPFTYTLEKGKASTYYLTDEGLEWFYEFFKAHSFTYCRSLFSHLLIHAEEGFDPASYSYFSNFRGTDGIHAVAGTKQKALLIHKVKRCERKYSFDTIKEAREALRIYLTRYPIEDFKLYRVREQKGYTFKEEIPLIIERKYREDPFKRGVKK